MEKKEILLYLSRIYYQKNDLSNSQNYCENIYRTAIIKSNEMSEKWYSFVEIVKDYFSEYGVRDFGFSHIEPCFKLQIGSKTGNGLFFCLSTLGPYFGFYYCDYKLKNVQNGNIINLITGDKMNFVSFLQMNDFQIKLHLKLSKIVSRYFIGFSEVDSNLCSYQLHDIIIEGVEYKNVQLFHLLFTKDIDYIV